MIYNIDNRLTELLAKIGNIADISVWGRYIGDILVILPIF